MFKQIVSHDIFAWFDLGVVSLCGALLFFWPQLGWWPLLLALLPWLLRLLAGQFPWQPTPLDGLLLLFLVTAVLAAFLSYNSIAAWSKFRLIAVSIVLYLSLSRQPEQNLWPLSHIVTVFGLLIAFYFLITRNWPGQWVLHPNVAASLMAMCLPFSLACGIRAWWKRRWLRAGIMGVAILTICLALLLTGSRGALAALLIALGVWVSGSLSVFWARRLRLPASLLFGGLLFAGVLLTTGLAIIVLGGVNETLNLTGGPIGRSSRYDLWVAVIHLIRDFRFTGSGLASFSGLYSHYILVIPFHFLNHAHNLYWNVALEQGVFAAVILLLILSLSCWMLIQAGRQPEGDAGEWRWLRWAAAASILVMILHGMIDDPLYGGWGSPLLFLTTGLTMAVTGSYWRGQSAAMQRRWFPAVGIVLVITAAGLLLVSRPLSATWAANRGALAMAKVELADWPTNGWANGSYLPKLEQVDTLLTQAAADPTNVTVQYRLGLLAMLRQDYETAVIHLETAHQTVPHHRGVTKNLGYSYVWLGDFDQAAALLADIPEARSEMAAYVHWWQQQDRPDLAARAVHMTGN